MIRTGIVDDLPLARDRVRRLLGAHSDVVVVGHAGDAQEATAMVLEARPTLLMLDINMPGMNGLDLTRTFSDAIRPLVVFLTAHAEYALPSWEVGAVDYLLKPVGEQRLTIALDRVRAALATRRDPAIGAGAPLVIRDGSRTTFIAPADIDYVDVAGHYLCIHVGTATHLLRAPLAELAQRLEPSGFVRVHRSVIVPLQAIVAVAKRRNGDADLMLSSGATVPMSRAYRAAIEPARP